MKNSTTITHSKQTLTTYYDVKTFKNTKTLWDTKQSLSLFHTNMCSLQANIEHLEDLLHDMNYDFDVLALTETWHSDKTSFSPKRLDGYLDYLGTKGSSLKGGCGFYIKDSLTPIPRKDLEFKLDTPGSETETCWIELVNTTGPNTLIGTIYRHPSKNNELFLENLKKTLKK